MGLVLTSLRGGHGSRDSSREEETRHTRERLSSLIRQRGLTGGRDDCYWVLLAESSTDSFVILQGISDSCWRAACNDEFQLVAVGSAASEYGCLVFWPGATDLARVAHKIMRKKRNATNDSEIFRKSAIRGLLICHLVGCEARFSRPEELESRFSRPEKLESRLFGRPWLGRSSLPSLDLDLKMLSEVLKPPSLLAAAATGTASSSSAPLALVSVAMDINPSEAAGSERYSPSDIGSLLGYLLLLKLAGALPQFITRSSGRRGRNGGVIDPPAWIELLVRCWCRDNDLETQRRLDYDLEAGGQAHRVGARRTGGGAATPVEEPSEVAKTLEGVLIQAYAAFLPACVTAYPVVKDAPDHIKFTIFGGLAFIAVGLFIGILSKSVARRGLAIQLVSFSAIAVLAFCVASQLSSRTFVVLTALVGVAVNLIIMLLRF